MRTKTTARSFALTALCLAAPAGVAQNAPAADSPAPAPGAASQAPAPESPAVDNATAVEPTATAVDAPVPFGVQFHAQLERGARKTACAPAARPRDLPAAAAAWVDLSCAADAPGAAAAFAAFMKAPGVGADPAAVWAAWQVGARVPGFAAAPAAQGTFGAIAQLPGQARDTARHEALASLTAAAWTSATDAAVRTTLGHRLYTAFGDTKAGKAWLRTAGGQNALKALRKADARGLDLARARALAARHANRLVMAALKPHTSWAKKTRDTHAKGQRGLNRTLTKAQKAVAKTKARLDKETAKAAKAHSAMKDAAKRHAAKLPTQKGASTLKARFDKAETARKKAETAHQKATADLDQAKAARAAYGAADPVACEMGYLLGKTSRKVRRYSAAKAHLKSVKAACGDPWRKNALYLTARVASFGAPSRAHGALDAFVAAYGEDSFTDDVLFWKAIVYERQKNAKAAMATYKKLLAAFPSGDMAVEAAFRLAMWQARSGDIQAARATLLPSTTAPNVSEIVFGKKKPVPTQPRMTVTAHDRARYWHARLAAFPDFATLKPTTDSAALAEGARALDAFAKARPASYYGQLARQLAHMLSPAPAGAPPLPGFDGWTAPKAPAALTALHTDAQALHAHGFIALARWSQDAALRSNPGSGAAAGHDRGGAMGAVWMADAQYGLGALDKSHQAMRFSGLAVLDGKPAPDTLGLWRRAYPLAHESALRAGASAADLPHKLPPLLLQGLSREESAFDASVRSWAGATGLCQLMPATAKEEAAFLKLDYGDVSALRDPVLNARLGARHLSRRWAQLGHPLLAIAAYNAGPGNVNKWRRAEKRIKAIDAWVETIPVEQTRNYVKKVTGAWVTYTYLDGRWVKFPMAMP